MNQEICLSKRLLTIAELVKKADLMADIGTDHAQLPVYLVRTQKVKRALACDIAQGPLEAARKTIERFGLLDKIELILTDGLHGLADMQPDVVVIAGLGSESIQTILEDAPWLCRGNGQLILQPMHYEEKLRRYLYKNGFFIQKEVPVFDKGHVYSVMEIGYCGICEDITDVFSYIGKIPFDRSDARVPYIQKMLSRLKGQSEGLKLSGGAEALEKAKQLDRVINSAHKILEGVV